MKEKRHKFQRKTKRSKKKKRPTDLCLVKEGHQTRAVTKEKKKTAARHEEKADPREVAKRGIGGWEEGRGGGRGVKQLGTQRTCHPPSAQQQREDSQKTKKEKRKDGAEEQRTGPFRQKSQLTNKEGIKKGIQEHADQPGKARRWAGEKKNPGPKVRGEKS